jgi:hypothetical protein
MVEMFETEMGREYMQLGSLNGFRVFTGRNFRRKRYWILLFKGKEKKGGFNSCNKSVEI